MYVQMYLAPEWRDLGIVYAGKDLLQFRGHHHQSLDPLLQLHQRAPDGSEKNVVALNLCVCVCVCVKGDEEGGGRESGKRVKRMRREGGVDIEVVLPKHQ